MDRRFHSDSRISENFTEDGLEMITGQDKYHWLTYIAKELVDNSLEACENPKIEITCWLINEEFARMDVQDNGLGIPKRRINKIFKNIEDFGGTKRHYKLPTRGSQGNALMSIFGIQSLFDRPLQIHSNNTFHIVSIISNDLRGEPEIQIKTKKVENIKGLKVSFFYNSDEEWGLGNIADIKKVFLYFVELNPQAEIKLIIRNKKGVLSEWNSQKITEVNKLTLGKQTTTGKVSWFSTDEFLERLKADIRIEPNLFLKNFIAEFYGFSSPQKVKQVMTDFDSNGCSKYKIQDFLNSHKFINETAACNLYESMKIATKIFREDRLATTLGSIGREGMKKKLLTSLEFLDDESFNPSRSGGYKTLKELDVIVEFASTGESKIKSIDDLFFYCGKGAVLETSDKIIPHYFELIAVPTSWDKERSGCDITFGINQSFIYSIPGFLFSVKQRKGEQSYERIDTPFYRLRYPFQVICNLTCPTMNYRDRGKQLFYTNPFLKTMEEVIGKVIRKIESDLIPILNKMNKDPEEVGVKSILGGKAPRGFIQDFVFHNFMNVYNQASDKGKHILLQRQFYYAMRRWFLTCIKAEGYIWTTNSTLDNRVPLELKKATFDQLVNKYEVDILGKRIIYKDPRGFFGEPHSNRRVNLSTIEVRNYIPDLLEYNNLLFVEKAGFYELLHNDFKLTKKYDIGIINSKGWATIALRDLIEKIQEEKAEVKLYTLTDLDIAGVGIRENVKKPDEISVAEAFNCETVGLRLEDLEEYNLEIEPVRYSNSELSLLENRYEEGEIDQDLYDFFGKGQRVEINVFTPVQLRDYLETRFKELGIEKLKPEEKKIRTFKVDSPEVFYRQALWDAVNDYIAKTESSLFGFLKEKIKVEGSETEKKLKELSEGQQKIIYDDILEELKKFPPKNWVAINDEIIEEIESDHDRIKGEYEVEIRAKARKILEQFVDVEIKIIKED